MASQGFCNWSGVKSLVDDLVAHREFDPEGQGRSKRSRKFVWQYPALLQKVVTPLKKGSHAFLLFEKNRFRAVARHSPPTHAGHTFAGMTLRFFRDFWPWRHIGMFRFYVQET
jgi:hypothetical protein